MFNSPSLFFNDWSAYETRTTVREMMLVIQQSLRIWHFHSGKMTWRFLTACHSIITVLTISDSVAVVFSSDERSFSKLKLIKTYLRSCMA